MLANTTSFTLDGITARPVNVEVDIQRGLPNFQIIGMPDHAVRETRERVRAALINSGFEFPLRRITVNVTPADQRRTVPGLDLAIAAGVLAASSEIDGNPLPSWALVSELALDGKLRPVRGALAMAEAARTRGLHGIIVAPASGPEAALAPGINVRTLENVSDLKDLGRGGLPGDPVTPMEVSTPMDLPDLADLHGQGPLRHALEVAAAGGHGMLVVGPVGSGRALAARRLPSILPPLDGTEILEVARIGSSCGVAPSSITGTRPFRAPHHTVSAAGLVGGGSPTRPGEITLAHRGVLFLDEIAEFRREALGALKSPLETKQVEIVRGSGRQTLPADFQLIAAAAPCPCGRGTDDPNCQCSNLSLRRYRDHLNGALTESIDIRFKIGRPAPADLVGSPGESSATVRDRVIAARERMSHRYGSKRTNTNATPAEVAAFEFTTDGDAALSNLGLPGRIPNRVLKLARTLADLSEHSSITEEDLDQAVGLTVPSFEELEQTRPL